MRRTRGWKREDMAPWARSQTLGYLFGRAVTYRICLLGVWHVSGQPYWTPIRSGSGSGVMGVVGTVSKGGEVGETPSKLCAVATLLSRGGRGSPPQLRKLGATAYRLYQARRNTAPSLATRLSTLSCLAPPTDPALCSVSIWEVHHPCKPWVPKPAQ